VDIVADILFPEDKDGLAYWVSFLARVSRLVGFFDFTVRFRLINLSLSWIIVVWVSNYIIF